MTTVCVYLFDRHGVHEPIDRNSFALAVAHAVAKPVTDTDAYDNYRRGLMKYLSEVATPYVKSSVMSRITTALDSIGDVDKTREAIEDLRDWMFDRGHKVDINWRAIAAANHILTGRVNEAMLPIQMVVDAGTSGTRRITQDFRTAFIVALLEARV